MEQAPRFWSLVIKELRSIVASPRFVATFAVCAIIIIVSVVIGTINYKACLKQYEIGRSVIQRQLQEKDNWPSIENKVYRRPDPMQIFVSGVSLDLGRWSKVSAKEAARLSHSFYSEEPLSAVFRSFDLSFVVLIVLSLFALAFTYDSISGEKESGTLRLVFSNSISRARFLLAKCAGAWLALVVPLLVPILIGFLIPVSFGVVLGSSDWWRLLLFLILSIHCITFFVMFGFLVSTLTRRSSTSFLLCLVSWLVFAFVIPRMGMETAAQAIHVPSLGKIEGQRSAYTKDRWKTYFEGLTEAYMKFYKEGHTTMEESFAFQDSTQTEVRESIAAYEAKLLKDRRRSEYERQRLGFLLSRLSPASTFQLGSMNLANTDAELKLRFESSVGRYSSELDDYFQAKGIDPPGTRRITSVSSGAGDYSFSFPSYRNFDLSDLQEFVPPPWPTSQAIRRFVIDAGLLLGFTLLAFVASWVAFLRYDLR